MKLLLGISIIILLITSCEREVTEYVIDFDVWCKECDTMYIWYNVGPRMTDPLGNLEQEYIPVTDKSWNVTKHSFDERFQIHAYSNCESDINIKVYVNSNKEVDKLGNNLKIHR